MILLTLIIYFLLLFINRSTNASAESFNVKIKAFRSLLREATDMNFSLFR